MSNYGRQWGEEALVRVDHPCSPFLHTCDQGEDDGECCACGARDCPDHEPGHYWHDGCPACYLRED